MNMPGKRRILTYGAALVVLTLGAAPFLTSASDHLDAPALGGVTNSTGGFGPHSEHGDRDLADLYVFPGRNPSHTVLVMTSNPAINLFGGKFGSNVRYIFNIDRNGDAVQDLAYVITFDAGALGNQTYTVTRYRGQNAVSLTNGVWMGSGSTSGDGTSRLRGDGRIFAGVRSDPFFFDLAGFEGSVFGVGSARLGGKTDFFAPLNINGIVIEVPSDQLTRNDNQDGRNDDQRPVTLDERGGNHDRRDGKIGVWAATQFTIDHGASWTTADQVGRPAINTVFNNSLVDPSAGATKNAFNQTPPSQQQTALGGKFRTNVIATLTNINAALSTGHPDYTAAQAAGIADILLPDILTYTIGTPAVGPLNGRTLTDDVIDIELGLTTNGSVTSDGVGPHGDYLSSFPYLGIPH